MIEDFIQSEKEYFKPILDAQNSLSKEQLNAYRSETLTQRKNRISLETYELCKGTVSEGLFTGLKLQCDTYWGANDLGSQCLGLYEKEVLNLILKRGPFQNFINIGAADGYYPVGMLHSAMASLAICFEVSDKGQKLIKKNWLGNDAKGELEIYGEANATSIQMISHKLVENSLVLIDIEGAEFSLLTSPIISLFKKCELIIEIHNWVENFLQEYTKLLYRLEKYFCIVPVEQEDRETRIPLLKSYPDDNRLLLASEGRPGSMRFLHLIPRSKNNY